MIATTSTIGTGLTSERHGTDRSVCHQSAYRLAVSTSRDVTDSTSITPPPYSPPVHPYFVASSGVTAGASVPPTLPRVFRIPPPVPTFSRDREMATAHEGPSAAVANPNARESRITVCDTTDARTPKNKKMALHNSPTIGTMPGPRSGPKRETIEYPTAERRHDAHAGHKKH